MRLRLLAGWLLIITGLGFGQPFEGAFVKREEWRFPKETVSGYIWDAEVDDTGALAIMFFHDGIKIVAPDRVAQLAPVGQGPGDIERWMALAFDGKFLVDVEASGKLKYFEQISSSYVFKKQDWLLMDRDFPAVRGAAFWNGKWYLAGFSNSDPLSTDVKGYFLSLFQGKKRPAKRFLFKNFGGAFRGPSLLSVHVRRAAEKLWIMLESEPLLYIFSCRDDKVENTVQLPVPEFYRPIKDYWPFVRDPLSKIKVDYEKWLLSYSRIENIRITDNHLVVQVRTANQALPKFAMIFYKLSDYSMDGVYLTGDYFLAERKGRYYFFKDGNPGLDEDANSINILVFEKK
jgi:hypothetical protein